MADHALQVPSPTRRPELGIDYERLYQYRFRDVEQTGKLAVWREIAQYVHARMGAPERMLDPAAGRGEFIRAVPAGERWAVDMVKQADLEADGVKMIISDIMDADLPADYFDGVWVSNFLEHLHAAGFDVTTVIPRFLPYSFRGLLPPSPALTSAYLRTPALWRLLGKQFFLIARK